MKQKIFFAILGCCLIIFSNCRNRQVETQEEEQEVSLMERLVKDYHRYYCQHWGNQKEWWNPANDTLEINATLFQSDDSVFIAVEASNMEYVRDLPDFYFRLDENDSLPSDMLGYYEVGVHHMCIYDQVDSGHKQCYAPFVDSLICVDPHDKLMWHLDRIRNLNVHFTYSPFFCVFHLDVDSTYCLVDSGRWYHLRYRDNFRVK